MISRLGNLAFPCLKVAERVGFEPTMRLPPYRFSSAVPDVMSCNARHDSVWRL